MADQHNQNIPAIGNAIAADIPDIKENLEYHKDVFQAFVNAWSDTVATDIKPKIMGDADNDTLIQCEESADEDMIRFDIGGVEKAILTSTGFIVLGIQQGLDVTVAIHRKIVSIGDWDMDATNTASVAHGISMSKIRSVGVTVRNDADSAYYSGIGSTNFAVQVLTIGATTISLVHTSTGGAGFDSANFDSTSFNRGWVVIDYVD
jgi:hypothetical protein